MTGEEEPRNNRQTCRQHCPGCSTFEENNLKFAVTRDLFCAHGKSEVSDYSTGKECNCFQCEVFQRDSLKGGWFCLYGIEGKK
jgi:hypothetical protein